MTKILYIYISILVISIYTKHIVYLSIPLKIATFRTIFNFLLLFYYACLSPAGQTTHSLLPTNKTSLDSSE